MATSQAESRPKSMAEAPAPARASRRSRVSNALKVSCATIEYLRVQCNPHAAAVRALASARTAIPITCPQSGVVFGGSAVLSAVNNITPHIAGAVDIMVVEQPDGSRKATPFYGTPGLAGGFLVCSPFEHSPAARTTMHALQRPYGVLSSVPSSFRQIHGPAHGRAERQGLRERYAGYSCCPPGLNIPLPLEPCMHGSA